MKPYIRAQIRVVSSGLLDTHGHIVGYECPTCWAFIMPERTEQHTEWHERQRNWIKRLVAR